MKSLIITLGTIFTLAIGGVVGYLCYDWICYDWEYVAVIGGALFYILLCSICGKFGKMDTMLGYSLCIIFTPIIGLLIIISSD